ncbi:hypothetical protein WPS_28750 [Vulcanimicrobium alpinum]|uniref:Uncharacterized protein n=1 Tax=Vulcanimicrobium alpinum TaxID=3016050 RepID=A0AAN1XZ32_UNVUL|nr:hypothetical protein [Vulcanimicrobium alpinum]BDE07599.1 hypothetical protein WPS_28750 [Vulcanimicrobium alpinum]
MALSSLDLFLIAATVAAAVAAVAAMLAGRRASRAIAAQRAILRGALDVAGSDRIEDLVGGIVAARRRADAIAALAPAADEVVERQARLASALVARDAAGIAA